ncbi:hypothetical protein [Mesomycoplasma molare]|uniref:Uncharacterized protein n=1 Tax=Mesomycoplasma molare TaxID=171288 RepID=A0ABY5TY07_9BACT|nr:hypothetical protein [Mesomycoplasma molare]UWD34401.1 hypothetical protein NX772_01050 [Mesomycoplasma molare]
MFCIFDKDNEDKNEHKKTNEFIREHSKGYYEFSPNLEEQLGYKNKKSDNLEFYNHISNIDFSEDEYKIIFKSKLEDDK